MKLPSRFTFQLKRAKGFTHSAKVVEDQVEVKWSRGWHESRVGCGDEPYDSIWSVCSVDSVENWVQKGSWIIVDQPEAKQEDTLPDEFTLKANLFGSKFQCTRTKGGFNFVNERGATTLDSPISEEFILDAIQDGAWKIIDKKPLTAPQQKANAEYREQIQQLNNSIRIQEQTVEHHERMIANYKGRIADLEQKIVEEV